MATLPTGVKVPDSSNSWNLINDLTEMGLSANRVKSANSAQEAQAIVDALASTTHPASLTEPLVVYRADINQLYVHNGSGWKSIQAGGVAGENKRLGTNSIVTIGNLSIDTPLIYKFGNYRSTPSFCAYGNTYFDAITFATPFPTECINIQITPTWQSGDSLEPIVFDEVSKAGFRPFIVGKNVLSNIYSFNYMAVGR